MSTNGKYTKIKIHRLVALAYLPNPSNLSIVMHLDDDGSNNNLSNLRWATHQENMDDKKAKGRSAKYWLGKTGEQNHMYGKFGEKHNVSKLIDIQRLEIQ